MGSTLIIFSVFGKKSAEINNGKMIPLMCYLLITLMFRILAKDIDDWTQARVSRIYRISKNSKKV